MLLFDVDKGIPLPRITMARDILHARSNWLREHISTHRSLRPRADFNASQPWTASTFQSSGIVPPRLLKLGLISKNGEKTFKV